MSSRRSSVYTSPTDTLALDGAAGIGQTQDGFIACRVDCRSSPKIFQTSITEVRYHLDVKGLQKAVHDKLTGKNRSGSRASSR